MDHSKHKLSPTASMDGYSLPKVGYSVPKVPLHTPLGQGTHEHYIRPVPPFYVTEYEANYTWPPHEAFTKSQKEIIPIRKPMVVDVGVPDENGKDHDTIRIVSPLKEQHTKFEEPWEKMEEALEELGCLERETLLASRVKPEVKEHKLDDKIEKAYTHYKKKLSELKKKHPHPHGIHEQIINKMQVFCESVEAIKQAHYTEL